MTPTTIAVTTPDGRMDAYAFRPEGAATPLPAALFLHDGVGVRDELLRMASRLASNGYFVLVPDFFYRQAPYAPFDPKTVFQDAPERERLMKIIRSVTHELAMRDLGAALDVLAATPGVRADRVGLVGYCFGGRTAFKAAGAFPDRVAAAASIHGAGLATDRDDSPHLQASAIRARLHFAAAGLDPSFPPAEAERVRAALDAANVAYELETIPNVAHGFAVGDLPVYDAAAAEHHWEKVLALFRATL